MTKDLTPETSMTDTPTTSTRDDVAALRAEVANMKELVRAVLDARVSVPAELSPPAPLEPHASEIERFSKAWAAEPKDQIFINPDGTEETVRLQVTRKLGTEAPYPPRHFQINGIGVDLPVNEFVSVPASIAALYQHTVNPYLGRGVVKPITFDQAEARMGLG